MWIALNQGRHNNAAKGKSQQAYLCVADKEFALPSQLCLVGISMEYQFSLLPLCFLLKQENTIWLRILKYTSKYMSLDMSIEYRFS